MNVAPHQYIEHLINLSSLAHNAFRVIRQRLVKINSFHSRLQILQNNHELDFHFHMLFLRQSENFPSTTGSGESSGIQHACKVQKPEKSSTRGGAVLISFKATNNKISVQRYQIARLPRLVFQLRFEAHETMTWAIRLSNHQGKSLRLVDNANKRRPNVNYSQHLFTRENTYARFASHR